MIVRTHNKENFVLCERIKGGLLSMFFTSKFYTNFHFFVKESTVNSPYYLHFNWGYEPTFIDEKWIDHLWHKSITEGQLVRGCAELRGGVYPIYDLEAHNKKLEQQVWKFHNVKEEIYVCNSITNALLGHEKADKMII